MRINTITDVQHLYQLYLHHYSLYDMLIDCACDERVFHLEKVEALSERLYQLGWITDGVELLNRAEEEFDVIDHSDLDLEEATCQYAMRGLECRGCRECNPEDFA